MTWQSRYQANDLWSLQKKSGCYQALQESSGTDSAAVPGQNRGAEGYGDTSSCTHLEAPEATQNLLSLSALVRNQCRWTWVAAYIPSVGVTDGGNAVNRSVESWEGCQATLRQSSAEEKPRKQDHGKLICPHLKVSVMYLKHIYTLSSFAVVIFKLFNLQQNLL